MFTGIIHGQGNFTHSDQTFPADFLSNFLRTFPQVSFLRFLNSSGNNYPRRYYLGTIPGKIRRNLFPEEMSVLSAGNSAEKSRVSSSESCCTSFGY